MEVKMFNFSAEGVLIIIGILLLSNLIFYLFLKKMKAKVLLHKTDNFKKIAVIIFPIGAVLMMLSAAFYYKTQCDIDKSIPILRPVYEGVFEPVKLFAILIFMIGLTNSILGWLHFRHAKKSE